MVWWTVLLLLSWHALLFSCLLCDWMVFHVSRAPHPEYYCHITCSRCSVQLFANSHAHSIWSAFITRTLPSVANAHFHSYAKLTQVLWDMTITCCHQLLGWPGFIDVPWWFVPWIFAWLSSFFPLCWTGTSRTPMFGFVNWQHVLSTS